MAPASVTNPFLSAQPDRIHGVDFSGAVDAGRKIWIASGVAEGDALRIEACRPAEALLGSGREREAALEALRVFIAGEAGAIFGLDFPFALPACLMQHESWEAFALAFGEEYPGAEAFREACRAATGGRELWRVTDRETKTPFCAYNWRLYRQTYYGIRDVLAPLVREGRVCVPPMQPLLPDRAWLLEICPAATLKRLGLYGSYKGKTAAQHAARERIVGGIQRMTPLRIPARVQDLLLDDDGGDALDSVVAAAAAFRVLREPAGLAATADPSRLIEGQVYVWSGAPVD